MHTVLITGSNRGIGLEFVRQYLEAGFRVIACCRAPQQANLLNDLQMPNLHILPLDVSNFDSIISLAAQLDSQPIDILIHNAGVYPSGNINEQDWQKAFKINAMAPLMLTQALLKNLKKGQLKKVAALSSKMGSIDDNTSGGSYIYRSSKCALNMVMKSLSIDLAPAEIAVLTLHPGWVQTKMGGPGALISTITSVKGMRSVIDALNTENSGEFIAYDGKKIAW